MKKIIVLSMGLMITFYMVACANQGNSKKDITIALDWTPNTNHTGFYVASEKGYFEEAGFQVSIVQPPEDGAEMTVATGQAEYGISFQDSIAPLYAAAEEFPLTAVAALIQHNTSGIVSLKEKGITSPKDMEHHTYATWDLEVEKVMIQNVIETGGGDFRKLTLIPSMVTDVVSAFQTDSVDSVWVFYAWDGMALEAAGLETNMLYFKDMNPVFDYYSPIMIANTQYLEENSEDVKAFLSACKKGYQYAMEHPEEAAEILIREVPELDADFIKESQKWLATQYQAEAETWGEFDKDRWNAFYRWLYENQLIEQEIPKDYGFTNQYLQ